MCGIVGLLNTNGSPVSSQVVNKMTQSVAHRGPDDWGIEIRGEVGLGHRRLSIIDLEGGKQPLANEDGQIWITYNGEVYNFLDLRHDLQKRGHLFRTNSDTETIVHAYEEWGDDCVKRLRGMFAFCIVDFNKRRLFLARDHLGIKPLNYLHTCDLFAFASELQSFKSLPRVMLELDLHAIDEYLRLQYIPAPRTAFKQVRKLSPAHCMSISFDGVVHGPEEYWRLEFLPNYKRSEGEWIEALQAVLYDSVRVHLVSDVPYGAFLSGGVDSSAIVAYMSQILKQPVRTFSIGFKETEFNELHWAKEVAQRWGTEHHIEIVKPDAFAILPKLVQHYGEPFGDSSAIPTYYLCEMARRFVPMVLSGDGGDEILAGYDSYRGWLRWLSPDPKSTWKRMLYKVASMVWPHRYSARQPSLSNWLKFISYFSPAQRLSLWRAEYRYLCKEPAGHV